MRIISHLTALFALACASLQAEDWPHWRGPARDGTTAASSGYADGTWLSESPVWTGNFGAGGSSPVVVGDVAYFLGWKGGNDHLQAVEVATGRKLWDASYGAPPHARHATGDEGLYRGPSSTPEFDTETATIYTLGLDGELRAWDTRDSGRLLWRLNLYDAYHMSQRPRIGRSGHRDYGYTTSPLVHGDWLIVEVGGRTGTLVAFDKRTGKDVWSASSRRLAGHTGGLVPMVVAGKPCLAVLALTHLVVCRLDEGHTGETIAEYEWTTDFANNIATPAASGDLILITSGYNHEAMVCLKVSLSGATKVWEAPHHSKICSPVIAGGKVYFAFERFRCLDLATGRQLWEGGRFGDAGSCIYTADGRVIAYGGRGRLALVAGAAESPGAYCELASFKSDLFATDVWPHVVLANGHLVCKDREGNTKCFRGRD